MIKNIIFDIGNVLVNFNWKAFTEDLGYTKEINERIFNATVRSKDWAECDRGVLTDDEILEAFIKNDPGIETELRKMFENFNGLLIQFPYSKGFIKDLQNHGFKVYALSNMSYKAVRECADAMDFLPILDGYVLSCDVKVVKPDERIYANICDKYSLNPSECVFLDDVSENVEAAKKFGMKAIQFKDLKSAVKELEGIVKESEDKTFKSKYSKKQRIGAIVCLSVIGLLYLATFVLSLINAPWASKMLKVSLGSTLVLPILAWIYIWMIGKLTHKETIADFNFFKDYE